jgi:tetratricopeptide (TPR) repeat protein
MWLPLAAGGRTVCAAESALSAAAVETPSDWLVSAAVSGGQTSFQFSWLVIGGLCAAGAVPIVLGGFLIAVGGSTRSAATHVGEWIIAVSVLLLIVFVPEAVTERVVVAKDRLTATTGWWFWRDRVTVKFDDLHSFELKQETRRGQTGREYKSDVLVFRLFSGGWTRIDNNILLQNAVSTIRTRASEETIVGQKPALEFARLEDASWSDLSIEEYSALIRVKPTDPKGYLDRGRAYGKRGQFQKAIDDFSAALRLKPRTWLAHLGRGLARFELQDYSSAIRDFTEATRLRSTDSRAYLGRGLAYLQLTQFAAAEADFTEVLKSQPNDTFTLTQRGQARVPQGKYVDAMTDFRAVVRLAPDDPVGYRELARLWATCPDGEFRHGERALQYAIRACQQTNWQDSDCLDALACAHAECGHFDEATEWTEKALALAAVSHPDRLQAHLAAFRAGQPAR